ncbi:hypothetical protein HHO41_18395 [Bacillus sp. DNRA2]|uniref:hypothetical protein n=1 Tax=Bacillus sp. DNRA2 TaxID=2723053 RepID=UPI00145E51C8|nr:hypothetical protein [Bacillus sp. DNRA2]NMD72243.1 hypothetical protein [Bacillus sp. DNRA2]
MFDFLFDLLGTFFYGGRTGLNTKKIDKNIELLILQGWFNRIYEDEKYRKLFLTNKKVRAYLQSNFRVKKIIRNEKDQKTLLDFLDKQLNR